MDFPLVEHTISQKQMEYRQRDARESSHILSAFLLTGAQSELTRSKYHQHFLLSHYVLFESSSGELLGSIVSVRQLFQASVTAIGAN